LNWLDANAAEYRALLADLQQLVAKPFDDFKLAVTARIDAHKKAEVAKLEAETLRIRQEEEVKARAKIKEYASAKDRDEEDHQQEVISERTITDIQEVTTDVVIDYQREIRDFLEFIAVDEKKKQSIRPYLVEFVKFMHSRKEIYVPKR
jgi:hypothetical protein